MPAKQGRPKEPAEDSFPRISILTQFGARDSRAVSLAKVRLQYPTSKIFVCLEVGDSLCVILVDAAETDEERLVHTNLMISAERVWVAMYGEREDNCDVYPIEWFSSLPLSERQELSFGICVKGPKDIKVLEDFHRRHFVRIALDQRPEDIGHTFLMVSWVVHSCLNVFSAISAVKEPNDMVTFLQFCGVAVGLRRYVLNAYKDKGTHKYLVNVKYPGADELMSLCDSLGKLRLEIVAQMHITLKDVATLAAEKQDTTELNAWIKTMACCMSEAERLAALYNEVFLYSAGMNTIDVCYFSRMMYLHA